MMSNTEHTGGVKTIDDIIDDLMLYEPCDTVGCGGACHGAKKKEAKAQLEALMQDNAIEELERLWPLKEGEMHHEIQERLVELKQLRTTNQTLKGEE